MDSRRTYGSVFFSTVGGINRAGAAVPTFLRTPTMIQPHLDMKPFLQFPMETPPPPHSMSLFHNFNTVRADSFSHTNAGMLRPSPSQNVGKTDLYQVSHHASFSDWLNCRHTHMYSLVFIRLHSKGKCFWRFLSLLIHGEKHCSIASIKHSIKEQF